MNDKPLWSNIFFIGAGGIGMANLERYFLSKGLDVAGYDRTPSQLTDALQAEGAQLFFDDDPQLIGERWRSPEDTLVVYTPAVPADNRVLQFFRKGGFRVVKRAVVLGEITRATNAICVAGSHGKTTVSSMTALILDKGHLGCNAFLGGILRNTGSNLILSDHSCWSVVEADEYDRSFHQLTPQIAVITSTDPDHLDIYGDEEGYLEGFRHFTSLIREGGTLIVHTGLKLKPDTQPGVNIVTYCGSEHYADAVTDLKADYHATDIRYDNGRLLFTLVTPQAVISDVEVGVPLEINVDNAVAAAAAALIAGATPEEVRAGLRGFMGARRRFEFWLRPSGGRMPVLIDDYAHSPHEVEASIRSVKRLYPGRKLTVIFQPHLYTRTRDFAPEFARALSGADRVVLTEIYPARELPIDGIDSHLILNDVKSEEKAYIGRKDLLDWVKNSNFEILMTLGAADLDRLLPGIRMELERRPGS